VIHRLDLRGEVCPFTFVRTRLALEELPLGARLEVLLDHAPAAVNVPRAVTDDGQTVLSVESGAGTWRVLVEKRRPYRLEPAGGMNEP
jgi:tRNA 2-thiouridine synthesizing protein A